MSQYLATRDGWSYRCGSCAALADLPLCGSPLGDFKHKNTYPL
ncbi:MAG: hypothetical protein QF918_03555 [Pirellulaceae bacterium]|nr:hypothetical protein [Pirellulaceae bacterium]